MPTLGYIFAHKFAILSYMKPLSLNQPHVIVMVGIPGSGKTHFAEKFAETFNAPYIHHQKIVDLAGNTDMAKSLIEYQLNELLKTRQPIIIEGPTDTRVARTELNKKIRAAGYEPLLVWVQTDEAAAKTRATKKQKNQPAISEREFDQILKHFSAPNAAEKPVVISGKHTYTSQIKPVLQRLSRPPLPSPATPERPRRRNITVR
jgi:predicted kinase